MKKDSVIYVSYNNTDVFDNLDGAGESLEGLEKAIAESEGKTAPFVGDCEQKSQPVVFYQLVVQRFEEGKVTAYHALDVAKTLLLNGKTWGGIPLKPWTQELPKVRRSKGTDYAAWIAKITPELNKPGKVVIPDAPQKPQSGPVYFA